MRTFNPGICKPNFALLQPTYVENGERMRLLSLVLLIAGFGPLAITSTAQVPSTPSADPGQADSTPQNHSESPDEAQSARSFKGTIIRKGAQFVLKESSAHTFYKLDDQKKAKEYEGKRVTVTATMDPSSNALRVIDIVESKRPSEPTSKQ